MLLVFFFFKQKTAYEMRISDWSSDVCSSDLAARAAIGFVGGLVDDVAQVVEAAGVRRTAGGEPILAALPALPCAGGEAEDFGLDPAAFERAHEDVGADRGDADRPPAHRSEEHTSDLQSLMRISYAVFCLKKTKQTELNT